MRLFLFFVCRNVNTYIQTQPKQKLFEVDFKADSTAIVFWFVFVATLTHTYKRCGKVNTYIHLVILPSLDMSPPLLDFPMSRGAALCQTKKHQNNVHP